MTHRPLYLCNGCVTVQQLMYSFIIIYNKTGDDMISDNKKIYNIILEKEVKARIDKIAKEQDRSTSWLVNSILKRYYKNYMKNYSKMLKRKQQKQSNDTV
jgi:predicted DNA-binding protein